MTMPRSMRRASTRWGVVSLLGVLSAGIGIATLAWPGRTLVVLVALLGIHLLIFGALRLAWVAIDPGASRRALVAGLGAIGVVVGLVVLARPFRTLGVLAVILGTYWLVSGLIDLFTALRDRELVNRTMVGLLGAVSALAGAFVIAWPEATLLAVAVIAGVHLIAAGLILITLGLRIRRLDNDIDLRRVEMASSHRLAMFAQIDRPIRTGDDLSHIEGVGPKINMLLHAQSITTFGELAATPAETLVGILRSAGPGFSIHDPTTWPDQAALAAAGKWDELAALQEELVGGLVDPTVG